MYNKVLAYDKYWIDGPAKNINKIALEVAAHGLWVTV